MLTTDNHLLLEKTLSKWSEIKNDPFKTRTRIALDGITKLPEGRDNPDIERVTWALQDATPAKALADEPPIIDKDDFQKFKAWLDVLNESGLFSCVPININDNSTNKTTPQVHLVDESYVWKPYELDDVRNHLSRWIARHLHIPQLLTWVLKRGGHMHPGLRFHVRRSLADSSLDLNIPDKLRQFWTVLLDMNPVDPQQFVFIHKQLKLTRSDTERHHLEDQIVAAIAPRLEVHSGPSEMLLFRQFINENTNATDSIPIDGYDDYAHFKVTIGNRNDWYLFQNILNKPEVQSRHAETLTGYLEQVLSIEPDKDLIFYKYSGSFRPSIAPHDENHDDEEWTLLLDLVRDSYFSLAKSDPDRAAILLHRWAVSDIPLFKRLAIHALTDDPESDIQHAQKLLVSGRNPGMWKPELRRETLRFLRLAGKRIPRALRLSIVKSIHAGSRSKKPIEYIQNEKALRLYKLSVSGVRLNKKSMALVLDRSYVADNDADDQNELHSITPRRQIWIEQQEDFASQKLLNSSASYMSTALLEDSKINEEVFHGIALQKPVKAVSALRHLSDNGQWPNKYWDRFLWALPELKNRQQLHPRLMGYVSKLLISAPDVFFTKDNSSVAGFVKLLAEECSIDKEDDIRSLWKKAWGGIGITNIKKIDVDEVLNNALNHAAGKLAEAALIRLWKYEPKGGDGFPEPVRHYFESIIDDPNGHLGRVMLALRLYHLYNIDRHWVKKRLIPLLNPEVSEEATKLWCGYLSHSPTVSPDLLMDFKVYFLEVLKDSEKIGRRKRNLIGLFLTICLEAPNEISETEIRNVIGLMPEEDLCNVLHSLKNRFKGNPEERSKIWRDKVHPWLDKYWPRAAMNNTAKTSIAMVGMLVECGRDSFPEAVDWSLPYLHPIDGRGLYLIQNHDHIKENPVSVFDILKKVVDGSHNLRHHKHTLKEILDELKSSRNSLEGTPQFQKLYRIATGAT